MRNLIAFQWLMQFSISGRASWPEMWECVSCFWIQCAGLNKVGEFCKAHLHEITNIWICICMCVYVYAYLWVRMHGCVQMDIYMNANTHNSRLCTKSGMVAIATSAKCTRPSVARAVFTRVTSLPCPSRCTRCFVSKLVEKVALRASA